MKTTDNNCGKYFVEPSLIPDLKRISSKKIGDLVLEDNILVFPSSLGKYGDEIEKDVIFDIDNDSNALTTYNTLGFVGVNDTEVTIQSRFAQGGNDYFLHYMLQKVFSINLFDLKHSMNNESIFDFLLYLFPFYLKKALRQGLYKEYHQHEYNDSNVRGSIDFNRHIKNNMPFIGSVAYRVREHSYDNKITELVRHTIEFIKQKDFAEGVLNIDSETQGAVSQIVQVTSSYSYNSRVNVINENLKPFSHPYFFEYRDLQKICMQILRYEGLKYGQKDDKIYGLLFDGAWLWEEYLSTFLVDLGLKHPQNKVHKDYIHLFESMNSYKRYPDFYKDNFILDAKYKKFRDGRASRDDMHQIITYMYITKSDIGGFICPSADITKSTRDYIGKLNGYGGNVYIWRLAIPQIAEDYSDFCQQMNANEKDIGYVVF